MPMQIKLVDKITGKLLETHEGIAGQTVNEFLASVIPNYKPLPSPRFSIAINGRIVLATKWNQYRFKATDDICIYAEPKAAVGIYLLKALAAYALNYAVNYLFAPKVADNYNRTAPEGSSIYSANGQGNTPRLNGINPQTFGQHKYFFDVASKPFRQYENNVQYLYLLLCAGVGEYDITDISIGNTPIDRYETDIECIKYEPNQTITHEARRHIYTSNEVGGTSTNSGFELNFDAEQDIAVMPEGIVYKFENNTISAFSEIIADPDNPESTTTLTPFTGFVFGVNNLIRQGEKLNFVINHPYFNSINSQPKVYKVTNITGNVVTVVNIDDSAVVFTTMTVKTKIALINNDAPSVWIGAFLACPKNEVTRKIMLDIYYQGGVGKINDNMDIESITIEIEAQYRNINTESWTTQLITKTAATFDDLADTIVIDLPQAMTPEVRVRRVTSSSNDQSTRDKVVWQALKSELASVSSYPDVTILALKIKGTNAIAGNAENQINGILHRKLSTYNGSQWSSGIGTTNDLAPALRYIIKDSGLSDDQIDYSKLNALDAAWKAKGLKFNAVFDTDSTLFDALKRVSATGYAEPNIKLGKITFSYDDIRASYGQTFSYDNVTELSEDGTLFDPDEPDGVRVEYFSNETWKAETVDCLLADDEGINCEEVRAFGITDKTQAYRYGMRLRTAHKYLKRKWTLATGLEGLNADLGELVTIPHHRSQFGQVEAYDAATKRLTLSCDVEFKSGQNHFITVRKPDGKLSGFYQCTQVASNIVQLNTPLNFVPDFESAGDMPLFKFGTESECFISAVVKSIEPPGSDGNVQLELGAYDMRCYAFDATVPPA